MSVCVRLSASIPPEPGVASSYGGFAIRYVVPVVRIPSYFPAMGLWQQVGYRCSECAAASCAG